MSFSKLTPEPKLLILCFKDTPVIKIIDFYTIEISGITTEDENIKICVPNFEDVTNKIEKCDRWSYCFSLIQSGYVMIGNERKASCIIVTGLRFKIPSKDIKYEMLSHGMIEMITAFEKDADDIKKLTLATIRLIARAIGVDVSKMDAWIIKWLLMGLLEPDFKYDYEIKSDSNFTTDVDYMNKTSNFVINVMFDKFDKSKKNGSETIDYRALFNSENFVPIKTFADYKVDFETIPSLENIDEKKHIEVANKIKSFYKCGK